MKLGEDYEFVDKLKTDTVAIKLLTGPYKDIIYRYGVLQVKEAEDKSFATMLFSYDLLETAKFTETTLRKDKKFEEHIGIVLNSMLLDAADAVEQQHRIKENNGTNRKGDTEELIDE